MKKIFIDVGGHVGETLAEVLKPAYRFDVVHCLEPSAKCCTVIAEKYHGAIDSGRLILHPFGLADVGGEMPLYGGASSSKGASMFADKGDINAAESEMCKFVRASEFVSSNVGEGDLAVMKLNCEGAESLILSDLAQSGAIHAFASVRIDFDLRKIPSQQGKEREIIARLNSARFANYVLVEEQERKTVWLPGMRKRRVFRSHTDRVRQWLVFHTAAPAQFKRLTAAEQRLLALPPAIRNRWLYVRKMFGKLTCLAKKT